MRAWQRMYSQHTDPHTQHKGGFVPPIPGTWPAGQVQKGGRLFVRSEASFHLWRWVPSFTPAYSILQFSHLQTKGPAQGCMVLAISVCNKDSWRCCCTLTSQEFLAAHLSSPSLCQVAEELLLSSMPDSLSNPEQSFSKAELLQMTWEKHPHPKESSSLEKPSPPSPLSHRGLTTSCYQKRLLRWGGHPKVNICCFQLQPRATQGQKYRLHSGKGRWSDGFKSWLKEPIRFTCLMVEKASTVFGCVCHAGNPEDTHTEDCVHVCMRT